MKQAGVATVLRQQYPRRAFRMSSTKRNAACTIDALVNMLSRIGKPVLG